MVSPDIVRSVFSPGGLSQGAFDPREDFQKFVWLVRKKPVERKVF
jgi:hypothetical protein